MTVHFVCVKARRGKAFTPSKIANVGTKCCIFINPSATTALEGEKSIYNLSSQLQPYHLMCKVTTLSKHFLLC